MGKGMLGLLSRLLRADPAGQGRAVGAALTTGMVAPSRRIPRGAVRSSVPGRYGHQQRHPQRPRPARPPPAAPPGPLRGRSRCNFPARRLLPWCSRAAAAPAPAPRVGAELGRPGGDGAGKREESGGRRGGRLEAGPGSGVMRVKGSGGCLRGMRGAGAAGSRGCPALRGAGGVPCCGADWGALCCSCLYRNESHACPCLCPWVGVDRISQFCISPFMHSPLHGQRTHQGHRFAPVPFLLCLGHKRYPMMFPVVPYPTPSPLCLHWEMAAL